MFDGFPNQTILKLYSLETYFDLVQMYLFKAMHGKLVKSYVVGGNWIPSCLYVEQET